MQSSLKATLTALLLSSVALVPAATVTVLVTADAAYAKSDKAGGNGKGNGGGNGKGNGGSKTAGSSGKSAKASGNAGKSLGSTKTGKRVEGLFRKITGQDKKAVKSSRSNSSKLRVAKQDPMHPSNLGNMNGAMNANINAVLAHVRNGNTNGPVGHLAALAVANANAEGAQDVLDLQSDFDALDEALASAGYGSVQEYYDALDGTPGIDTNLDVEQAKTDLAADPENADLQQDLADSLAAAGYEGGTALDDYEGDVAGVAGAPEDENLNMAIGDLGGVVGDRIEIMEEPPAEEEIIQAESDLQAQSDAEQSILSYWNKNSDTSEEITGDEQMLLDALNDRLVGEEDAIRDAMGEPEVDAAECDFAEGCEDPLVEEEVVLIAE